MQARLATYTSSTVTAYVYEATACNRTSLFLSLASSLKLPPQTSPDVLHTTKSPGEDSRVQNEYSQLSQVEKNTTLWAYLTQTMASERSNGSALVPFF